ncbi:MAG TPA: Pvc16 family protein [Acidimicrobiales bacterium]|nr:Pvc16 family protein [Acidimicrobiales bacterium]
MIDEIDSALRAWLTSALAPTQVEVSFRAPAEQQNPQQNPKRPLVSVVLYDIVEEATARSNHVEDIRDGTGRVVARQSAPRRFVLSYQISVVVADAAIEHQLLGRIIKGGIDSDSLPPDELPEALRAAGLSVPLQIAKPRSEGGHPVDALRVGDAGWRTSLDLTLVVPFLPEPITEIAPPAEILDLGVSRERGNGTPTAAAAPDQDHAPPALENRKWTSVRRREPG